MPHEVILDSTNGPTPRQISSKLIKVAINSRQVKGGSVPIRHGFFYITFDSCKIYPNAFVYSSAIQFGASGVSYMIIVSSNTGIHMEKLKLRC